MNPLMTIESGNYFPSFRSPWWAVCRLLLRVVGPYFLRYLAGALTQTEPSLGYADYYRCTLLIRPRGLRQFANEQVIEIGVVEVVANDT